MDDGLGVAGGLQPMTALPQRVPELAIVVNLAVEDDPDRTILVADWLLAAFEVNDAQPSHAQSRAGPEVDPFLIGSAVHQHLAHGADFVFEDWFAVKANNSSDATHEGNLRSVAVR